MTSERELIVNTVRQFVEKDVIPVASAMERRDEYPDALVAQMEQMGLFGLNVPEEYGGADMDYTTFAMVFEELARGWLGLAGVLGTHLVVCDIVSRFGTPDQKQRYLPMLARADKRAGLGLSDPCAG